MTDLDMVYLAVASAGRPISSAEIGFSAEMEREAVSKALHSLSKAGRVNRDEAPNPDAGRNGCRRTMFVYTPASTGDKVSTVAEPVGDDVSPATPSADERAAKAAKPSKAKQAADGWTDDAVQAAALPRPRPRWLVTPMDAVTFDNREAAVDKATQLATSEGIDFAIVRLEAVASVKVEINWES